MPPKSNVPIRICGSKVRSGCRTCKQRHVKCDEGRPTCLKCQKVNRQCVYDPVPPQNPQQTNLAHRTTKRPISAASDYLGNLGPWCSLSAFGPHSVAEMGAVQHFSIHLGKELAGCFADEVWCQILPRVAQHEPSVWHGIVAVSMLDTNLRLDNGRTDGDNNIRTALQHYLKAIREVHIKLSSALTSDCKDVVLLSCILFTIFECLQSRFGPALRHISSGMKLLLKWEAGAENNDERSAGRYLNWQTLQPIFLSLDSQAIQMGVAAFREDFSMPAINSPLDVPTVFTSTEQANLVLTQIFNRMSHWGQFVEYSPEYSKMLEEGWIADERQKLLDLLAAWDLAFEPLKNFNLSPPALLLLIQRKVITAFFGRQIDGPSEMEWDKYTSLFEEAVTDAELYMSLSADQTLEFRHGYTYSYEPRPVFTVAMDIVLPLYLISVKCRDRQIRRRALKVLKICGRKEGIWDSYYCARVAETMIRLEENGALEDGSIPDCARIYRLDVQMDEESMTDATPEKLVTNEEGDQHLEPLQEAVTW